jgi:hypothetical protein
LSLTSAFTVLMIASAIKLPLAHPISLLLPYPVTSSRC